MSCSPQAHPQAAAPAAVPQAARPVYLAPLQAHGLRRYADRGLEVGKVELLTLALRMRNRDLGLAGLPVYGGRAVV